MTSEAGPRLAALASSALDRMEAVSTELLGRVVAAEAELADGVLVPQDDVREFDRDMLSAFYRYLAGRAPLDVHAVSAIGRRRAEQGVPLPAVLHGLRIGFQFVWENLVAQVDPGDAQAMGEVLRQVDVLWELLDVYSTELMRAYGEAEASRVRRAQSRRDEHLDILLGLTTAELSRQAESAAALGLPRRGRFQVLAVVDPPVVGYRSREPEFADRGMRMLWRTRDNELLGMVSLGRTASARDAGEILTGDDQAVIGISPVFDHIGDTGLALNRARIALGCVPYGAPGVRHYGDDPVGTLASCAPEAAHDLAARVLSGVFALPAHERAMLLDTLAAWFAAKGSTDRAAAALFCHRNTVRYRLRRLEDLTGRQLADPREAAHLYLALETTRQQGPERFPARPAVDDIRHGQHVGHGQDVRRGQVAGRSPRAG